MATDHFFEIFPCFHYQTVLITDAKVIYYIGTAIRANGDLRLYLKSVITSSPELRMMTETYRKRLAISKQFADPRPALLGVGRVSKGEGTF